MALEGTLALLTTVLGFVSAAVAAVFAGVVYRSGKSQAPNRRLAALLVAEAAMLLGLSVGQLPAVVGTLGEIYADYVGLVALSVAYLWFCTTLDSPLSRFARRPLVRGVLLGVPLAMFVVSIVHTHRLLAAGMTVPDIDDVALAGLPWFGYGLACLLALVFTLDAFRASQAGSATRRRARAYALAFGFRDGAYVLGIFGWGLTEALAPTNPALLQNGLSVFMTAMPLAFVALLAYGILSTQLFDIDLKIKTGISRSTVATLGLVVVLAAAKVAEFYLSKTYGFVAGGVAAGTLLVLAPRLNKLGDKVANAAMPQVQPTSDYIAFKKLEVYRAAVEAANETGGIGEKDRASLDRLRAKLGLKAADAAAIEGEVLAAA